MAKIHSYPWYARDWIASSTRLGLSAAQRGIFRDLLDHLYVAGGELPDDATMLRNMAACSDAEWRAAWPAVRALFHHADGMLRLPRATDVLRSLAAYRESRATAGRASGNARRARHQIGSTGATDPEHTAGERATRAEHHANTRPIPCEDAANICSTSVEPSATSTSTSTSTAAAATAAGLAAAAGIDVAAVTNAYSDATDDAGGKPLIKILTAAAQTPRATTDDVVSTIQRTAVSLAPRSKVESVPAVLAHAFPLELAATVSRRQRAVAMAGECPADCGNDDAWPAIDEEAALHAADDATEAEIAAEAATILAVGQRNMRTWRPSPADLERRARVKIGRRRLAPGGPDTT